MQVQKSEVLKVLNRLKPFFTEKSVSPILECLYFNNSSMQIYTGSIFAESIDSPLDGLKGSVKSTLFLKTIQHMPNDTITITIKDDTLKLSSGSVKANLKLIQDDYFEFDLSNEKWDYEINLTPVIPSLIKSLISTSELRPEFNGVFLKVEDKVLRLFSTDNVSISRIKMDYDNSDFCAFLPKLFCERLISLFEEYKEGTLSFSSNYIKCVFLTTTVVCPIENITIIDYEQTFKKWEKIEAETYPISIVQKTIERNYVLNSLMTEIDKTFMIEFTNKSIKIISKSDWGIVDESIEHTSNIVSNCKVNANLLKRFVDLVEFWKYIPQNEIGLWAGYSIIDTARFDHYFMSNVVVVD